MAEKISVIVPIYNVGSFLPSFFKAMLSQTFSNFVLYFVYDKSADNTLAVLQDLIEKNPKLQTRILYSPEKRGLGAARDFALDSGRLEGEYLISLDPDDVAHKDFFEKLVSRADSSKADITFCGFRRIDEKTNKTISTDMIHNPEEIVVNPANAFKLVFCNPSTWNKLIRLNLVRDCRYIYPGGSGEDALFFCKIVPYCQKIAFINEALIDYSIRIDSFSSGTNTKTLEKAEEGFLAVKIFYENHQKTHLLYSSFLEAIMYLRVGIGMTTRSCHNLPKKEQKRIISQTKNYLDSSFPGWRKNPYLSFASCFRGGAKTVMVWMTTVLYKQGIFRFFVSAYYWFVSTFHKDIKY